MTKAFITNVLYLNLLYMALHIDLLVIFHQVSDECIHIVLLFYVLC